MHKPIRATALSNGTYPNGASRSHAAPAPPGLASDGWHLPHTGPGRCIPCDRGMADRWHLPIQGPADAYPVIGAWLTDGTYPSRASRCIPRDRGMTDRWHLPHTGPGQCIPRGRGMADRCAGQGPGGHRRLYGWAGGAARSCQPPSHGSTSHRDQIVERVSTTYSSPRRYSCNSTA